MTLILLIVVAVAAWWFISRDKKKQQTVTKPALQVIEMPNDAEAAVYEAIHTFAQILQQCKAYTGWAYDERDEAWIHIKDNGEGVLLECVGHGDCIAIHLKKVKVPPETTADGENFIRYTQTFQIPFHSICADSVVQAFETGACHAQHKPIRPDPSGDIWVFFELK